ncbi:hypothetical protein CMEL01_05644 [Colletotrichum melonis]|uniref:Secreted protein n=1 Tax=Colletotrichum melonis TaxID=1209925 RepID=A0AAI9U927_9PEZI|nr:hypothetical protein CMEL01_05644 [Colletotrichum melonis]
MSLSLSLCVCLLPIISYGPIPASQSSRKAAAKERNEADAMMRKWDPLIPHPHHQHVRYITPPKPLLHALASLRGGRGRGR